MLLSSKYELRVCWATWTTQFFIFCSIGQRGQKPFQNLLVSTVELQKGLNAQETALLC